MNDPGSFDPKAESQQQSSSSAPESGGAFSEKNQPYSGEPDDLHDLFAVNATHSGDEEDPLAALRNDPNYSALIRDLEYIAKEAKRLFEPAQESPSDKVWENIQSQLGTKSSDA